MAESVHLQNSVSSEDGQETAGESGTIPVGGGAGHVVIALRYVPETLRERLVHICAANCRVIAPPITKHGAELVWNLGSLWVRRSRHFGRICAISSSPGRAWLRPGQHSGKTRG